MINIKNTSMQVVIITDNDYQFTLWIGSQKIPANVEKDTNSEILGLHFALWTSLRFGSINKTRLEFSFQSDFLMENEFLSEVNF